MIDLCQTQWAEDGSRIPFAERGQPNIPNGSRPMEVVAIGSDVGVGLAESMKIKRVCALLVKAHDRWDTTVSRIHKIQPLLDLSVDSEVFDTTIDFLTHVAQNCSRHESVKDYLKKSDAVVRDHRVSPKDLFTFMSMFADRTDKGDDDDDDDDDHGPAAQQPQPEEIFIGSDDGGFDSPEGRKKVQDFKKFLKGKQISPEMAEILKKFQPGKPKSRTATGRARSAGAAVRESTPEGQKREKDVDMGSGNPAEKKAPRPAQPVVS